MLDWLRDLRRGFRLWFRAPAFAATVIVTLALGIGATTALFTVVNAVLLNPLPFPKSRQLVQIWRSELPALTYGSASYGRYLDWRAGQHAFSEMGAWAPRGMTLAGREGPERVSGAIASASFFRVIGASPAAGRWFTDDEDRAGAAKVAVISASLWLRRFQGADSAVGSTVTIDGQSFLIVGVAPASYAETFRPDVWILLGSSSPSSNRDNNFLQSFARLRDGGDMDAARRDLASLTDSLRRAHPEDKYTFTVRPLHEVVTESATRGLWVLLVATGLLLLIACTNVVNLLLSRTTALERDLAIRASLGAARRHLIGHVTGETMALGFGAGVAGTALAWGLLRVFVALAPTNFPRMAAIVVDWRVLGVSLAIAIVAGLLTAFVPVVHLLRSDLNNVVRAGGSRSASSGRARSASRALVVAEVALALALTATAGLMVKSLWRLHAQDLGWTHEPVLTFSVGVPPFVASDNDAVIRFHSEFLDRIRAIPGVTHASAISLLPIVTTGTNGPVRRIDQTAEGDGVPVTEFRGVMDSYFDSMGVPLLAGRAIDARDHAGTSSVAVLNETLATRLFPTLDPAHVIGQQVRIGWLRGVTSEVIGVVKSVRSRRADAPPDPEVYVPFAHAPGSTMSYVVRSNGNPSALVTPIRSALADLSPMVPLSAVRTLDEIVTASTRLSGLLSWLSVLFGGLAVTLAVIGIYSVMSYGVAQRRRELAIRAAIGATRTTLVSLVAREGLVLSAIGIVAGAGLALLASGIVRSLLFDVSATDPSVFVGAALALAGAAFGGYVLPAWRASRVNPVDALRGE